MTDHPTPNSKQKTGKGGGSFGLTVLALVVIAVAGGGIFMRVSEGSALKRTTQEEAVPDVHVIKAPQGTPSEDMALPGNVQAWHEAPIYARTSGYLKDWVTDIGARVKAGDLIAEIDAPEIDAQLHQAEADLTTAQANNHIAQTTAERWQNLLKTNAVSRQDADSKIAAAAASAASETAAEANVNHLKELVSFERIIAPFDGIITARNTDNGALISAGSNGTGPELFHVAETDKLRVYAQVPESYADAVKSDLVAELRLVEHPGKNFPAKLVHSADALDPATRTLLIQLEVDNANGELLPGGYAEVHIKLPAANETVVLPANAFLFRAQGMQVATIDEDGNAVLKSVVIGRDYGNKIEIISGVSPDETIILNPPDSLTTGDPVHVVQDNQKDNADQQNKTDSGKDADEKNDKEKSNDSDQKP